MSARALLAIATFGFWLSGAVAPLAGEQLYRVKLTEIAIPEGASLGEVRRTIQPFPNWTLICDENLKSRTKICNVTQAFVDAAGVSVFSWSLAATEGGVPVFILRAPAAVGPQASIAVAPASGKPFAVAVEACDAVVCIATLPLGPALGREIARGEPVRISYDVRPAANGADRDVRDNLVVLIAPLNGLARALAAIE